MTLPRVLVVHNPYIHRGGEDVLVENEISALREAGVPVRSYQPRNTSSLNAARQALLAPFGQALESELEYLLLDVRPGILHVHNLFPLLSPRLFRAAKKRNIKTILSLHNYRPLCLNGLFLTPDREVCERCAPGNFWPGIQRGCYRGSRVQSAGLAVHLAVSRQKGWYDDIDCILAPCLFVREKFVQYGFPVEKFAIEGHFLTHLPESPPADAEPYVLYMGRLAEEKGIRWLLETFRTPRLPLALHMAGTGPLKDLVVSADGKSIRYLGFISEDEKQRALSRATALVMPSDCYENFPLVIMEANARGTPVIAPRQGGFPDILIPGTNGELYAPRDPGSFWDALGRIVRYHDPAAQRKACQQYAQLEFSKEEFLRHRLQLYQTMVGLNA